MSDDKYGANDRGLNTYNIRRKDELVKENERLRELLTRCLPYIHEAFCGVPSRIELIEQIRKEVGDE